MVLCHIDKDTPAHTFKQDLQLFFCRSQIHLFQFLNFTAKHIEFFFDAKSKMSSSENTKVTIEIQYKREVTVQKKSLKNSKH